MAAITTAIQPRMTPGAPQTTATRRARSTTYRAAGATTTYYYRQTNGTRGSATATASIPAGAVVERTVTA